ncbi:alginate O-acetyltransferase AlgF [Xylophilus sp. GOD-11R]|uniref:alginate O-acetyltransferase AlgF n=1 Tax=Xylophilus sp. GOD-11R TaxID=3089814 RepID=UPI00298CFC44|nr:alginate O-acetyltransferase AlgF [Xylophilus sp. GOD-11R]WPB56944.1 alginate O-acetyltransferase AlgF [Xylophilus sp. GOD-11R]
MKRFALLALAAAACATAQAAPKLYDTGPSQDSAFVRFVNAAPQRLEVVSGQARLPLPADKPVSEYLSVKPDTNIGGAFEGGGQKAPVSVKTAPGAFATVVALPTADGKGLRTAVIAESPDDFNALKSAIAFYNYDAGCKAAGLQTAGKGVGIFSGVAEKTVQRRMVNPVALSVQPTCDGQPRGASVDLGTLQAGQRYSLLLVPAGAGASKLIFAADAIAR